MRKSIADKIITLTLSSFVIKVLGFVFRIYLSNVIGTEGMGLYQLIISVYALGATISTSGIATALSRLIAINEKNAGKILKRGILLTQFIAWTVTLILYFNAQYISVNFLKDARTVASVKTVALSFPAIAFFASLSGYFNGLGKVGYPMSGQIAEQVARILFIFCLVSKAMKHGIKSALLITSWGIVIGEYISLVYLYYKYRKGKDIRYSKSSLRGYLREIIKICIPVSLSGYFQSFIHTVENMIIPGRFILSGYTHKEALSILGIIKGMAAPLIFFPTVVLSSVSTVSLPHISKAQMENNKEGIKRAAKKSFLLSFISGISVTALFLIAGDKICWLLYKNNEVAVILKKMSIFIPLMYMNIIANGVLNGLGMQVYMMINSIISGLLRTGAIVLLIPSFGVNGYMAALAVSEFVCLCISLIAVAKGIKKC